MDTTAPVYVDISNVARWFYEDNEEYKITSSSFPVILSPWPLAKYYFGTPRWINNNGKREPYEDKHGTVYAQIRNDPLDDEIRRRYSQWSGIDEAGFIQSVEFYFVSGSSAADGGAALMITDSNGGSCSEEIVIHPSRKSYDQAWFYPIAMAISLLHCRNVELRDRPISRQQRRMAERTGKPVITYKELVIDAFRKQVRYESEQSGENQIKRALHICRGHFATYTDDAPLFGKHTGMFWRPMHVRGHKEAGEVHKTYKVNRGE